MLLRRLAPVLTALLAVTAVVSFAAVQSDVVHAASRGYVYDSTADGAHGGEGSSPPSGTHDQALLSGLAAEVDVGRGYDDRSQLARASARPGEHPSAPPATPT